jgi:hypothetical protein
MKKLLLTTAVALGMATTMASADTFDPLHGMVCSGVGTGCSNAGDNGAFTPLGTNNWGFAVSPGPATGDLTLVFMVPTDQINVGNFNLPGLTDNGTAVGTTVFDRVNLFNASSPVLPTYLGLAGSFSPTDNFSNMSAGTSTFDPTFSGNFLVFTATVSNITLGQPSSTPVSILNDFAFGSSLPIGTAIAGLFHELSGPNPDSFIATAASGHLVVPGPVGGAGLPGIVAGCLGLLVLARRRRNQCLE